MTELQWFRPRLARSQHVPFNFERASIQLLSTLRIRGSAAPVLPPHSEWRDAPHLNLTGPRT